MLKIILLRFFLSRSLFSNKFHYIVDRSFRKIEIVRNDILTESFEGAEEGGEEELIFEGVIARAVHLQFFVVVFKQSSTWFLRRMTIAKQVSKIWDF